MTKDSLGGNKPRWGPCLIYCQQCEPSSVSDNTETEWPISKGHIPHTPEAAPTGHFEGHIIGLLQIKKTHFDWFIKLPFPLQFPREPQKMRVGEIQSIPSTAEL